MNNVEMNELWNNNPTECKLCNRNIAHYHYAMLMDDEGEYLRKITVINDSYKGHETESDFVRWASTEDLDRGNKEINDALKEINAKLNR